MGRSQSMLCNKIKSRQTNSLSGWYWGSELNVPWSAVVVDWLQRSVRTVEGNRLEDEWTAKWFVRVEWKG